MIAARLTGRLCQLRPELGDLHVRRVAGVVFRSVRLLSVMTVLAETSLVSVAWPACDGGQGERAGCGASLGAASWHGWVVSRTRASVGLAGV